MATSNSSIVRTVSGIEVHQKIKDGFINGTAMCKAHAKEISEWVSNAKTIELLEAFSEDLGFDYKPGISPDSSVSRVSAAFHKLLAGQ